MNEIIQSYVEAETLEEVGATRVALVNALKEKYSGIDSHIRGADAIAHERRFVQLMREWSPVLFSVQDIESIAGTPNEVGEEAIVYVFDNGLESSEWRFAVAGGIIMGIEYIPGD